jgi:hypothetical protein
MNLFCGERNLSLSDTYVFVFMRLFIVYFVLVLCWLGCVNEKAP